MNSQQTTGVDPIARRQFWAILAAVRDSGQAVVLTSHRYALELEIKSYSDIADEGGWQLL
jgi:ABC-type multidrug transport system ATPase subunit